jgi:membrane associated rhomboid family serine protease
VLEAVTGEEPESRPPFAWVVTALVVANCVVWLLQLKEGETFTNALAAVPYELTHGIDLTDMQWVTVRGEYVPIQHAAGPTPIYLTLLSSMFLHSSWAHLLSNMLYLSVFGAPIERRTGPFRFFAFYLFCGLAAGVAHVLSASESMVPMVGASGAISGILGAYVLTFPLSEVPTIIRLLTIGVTPRLPAAAVFGFWLFVQWIEYLRADPRAAGGVAFMAHIGGFLTGLVLAAFIIPNPPPPTPKRHGWISH